MKTILFVLMILTMYANTTFSQYRTPGGQAAPNTGINRPENAGTGVYTTEATTFDGIKVLEIENDPNVLRGMVIALDSANKAVTILFVDGRQETLPVDDLMIRELREGDKVTVTLDPGSYRIISIKRESEAR